jgi:GNAT superfamily N-acetyltransferase
MIDLEADAAIAAAFPLMRTLRPHLADAAAFTAQVQRQRADGYRLSAWEAAGTLVALAGWRIGENLANGRFAYVDDLVTSEADRGAGHGGALLEAVRVRARAAGCAKLVLDSGFARLRAHRFYYRQGMLATSLHFVETLEGQG